MEQAQQNDYQFRKVVLDAYMYTLQTDTPSSITIRYLLW